MKFSHTVAGAELRCENCGIHIHTGTTCNDASLVGGHYWDASKTEDLWTAAGGAVYNTNNFGDSKAAFNLTNGYDIDDNVGHAVVIHASSGERIGCGLLSYTRKAFKTCTKKKKKINLEACIGKYPGYEGNLDITGKVRARYWNAKNGKVVVKYSLKGADTDCETCGLHIHTGTTCDDASLVGGHYWDATKVEDPWKTAGGSIYKSDSSGVAKDKFAVNAGYNATMNVGHAVVVHDKATGARYGCGVLDAKKAKKCN